MIMKKKIFRTFAGLLIAGMLLCSLPFATFAEVLDSDISYKDKMLIHYDFSGATKTEALSNKAGNKNTGLTAVYASNGAYSIGTDGKAQAISSIPTIELETTNSQTKNFSLTNGTVAMNSGSRGLISDLTADTTAIQTPETSGTWFFRVKLAGNCVILSFRNNVTDQRPYYLYYKADGKIDYAFSTGTVTTTDLTVSKDSNGWAELAVVRTYREGEKNPYLYEIKTYQDGQWVRINHGDRDATTAIHSAEKAVIGLFGDMQYESSKAWSISAGNAYDDIRYYSCALSDTSLSMIRQEVLGESVAQEPITVLGAQRSLNAANGTYSVRLVAQITGDADLYMQAGFLVTAQSGSKVSAEKTLYASYACKSILAAADDTGGLTTVNAAEGCFLIAVVIDGISAEDYPELTFRITPFASNASGTVKGRSAGVLLKNSQIESAYWLE